MAGHDGPLAVAVSGGGDSLAMMYLLADLARANDRPPPVVLTVDHGLQESSAKDARQVTTWAKDAGLKAVTLRWRGNKPERGVEAAAREARYALMGAWLKRQGIAALCVGHTQDDQAETFLLRLARGSGLDGLSAMQAAAPWPQPGFENLRVVRPLLAIERQALRDYLLSRSQPWLEDAMNDDPAFDRVRIRQAAEALAQAGISPARIAAACAHLARARTALDSVTDALLAGAVRAGRDGLLLDPQALAAAPREIGLRALASALMTVSGQAYRPRFEALERLFDQMAARRVTATLHGCRIGPAPAGQRLFGPATLWLRPEAPRTVKGSLTQRERPA